MSIKLSMTEKTIKKKKRIYFRKNKKTKDKKDKTKITKKTKKKKQKGGIDGIQRNSIKSQINKSENKSKKTEFKKSPKLESKVQTINECSKLAMECLRLPGVRNSDGVIDKNKCLVELRKKYEKTDNYKSVIKCAFSPYFIDLSAYEDRFDQIKFQFDNNPVLNEYFDEISDKTKFQI